MYTRIKTINIFVFAVCCFLMNTACKKSEPALYDYNSGIYFDLNEEQRDSIVFTFAYDINKSSDTILIPVRISGFRTAHDRYYSAYIEQDSSTAIENIHFETLQEKYVVPSEEGQTYLPLIVYNVKDLEDKNVSLIIKLKSSEDFHTDDPQNIRTKIILSAQLEQPIWWSMWLQEYSRTKHQLFIIATGQTDLTMDPFDAPKNLYFADLLKIMLNNPFKWVEDNPDKGYKLQSKDNGNTYEFFHIDNPSRVIILKKNIGTGQYHFIDELGKEVR